MIKYKSVYNVLRFVEGTHVYLNFDFSLLLKEKFFASSFNAKTRLNVKIIFNKVE